MKYVPAPPPRRRRTPSDIAVPSLPSSVPPLEHADVHVAVRDVVEQLGHHRRHAGADVDAEVVDVVRFVVGFAPSGQMAIFVSFAC